jgi:hypothetical protein
MVPLLSFARSTAQQVGQWWWQRPLSEQDRPLTQLLSERLQRLRRDLDALILSRLPQFRDVVEEKAPVEPAADHAPPLPEERRREAARVIDNYSWLAAANAFNPIPGLDIKLDLTIFTNMTRNVAAAYNLSEEQLEALQADSKARLLEDYEPFQQLAKRLAPFLAGRATALALGRIGLDVLAREATKWIPAVGSAVAAGIGYHMISRAGEQLRKECEEAAGGPVS